MSEKKSHRTSLLFAGIMLGSLALGSSPAMAHDGNGRSWFGHSHHHHVGYSRPVASAPQPAPEIDIGSGGYALALLAGGLTLVAERRRSGGR